MIGYMLARIRNEKNIGKTELARKTKINLGHIIHMEKEERNPSHRALKILCRALGVPYQPLMFTYDKTFTESQKKIGMEKHISYDKVLAVDSLDSFITCPIDLPSSALAVKIKDDTMEPMLTRGSFAFMEFNSPLENRDIGVFEYKDKVIIRRFIIQESNIILSADNKNYSDIIINFDDNYNIIGKIIGTNTGLIF